MIEPDPIVEETELSLIREALAAAADNDIRRIAEAAQARQAQSGRTGVTLPPRAVKDVRKPS